MGMEAYYNNNVAQQSAEQVPNSAVEQQEYYEHEHVQGDPESGPAHEVMGQAEEIAQPTSFGGEQAELKEDHQDLSAGALEQQVELGGSTMVTPQVKRKRGRPPSAGRTVIVRQERDDERTGQKRQRGRPRGSKNKIPRAHSVPGKTSHMTTVGQPATHQKPLVLNIHNGEDVTDRLKRFCDENQCSLVVQAATGTLSEATLTQQCTGRGVILKNTFTILSLSGALIRSAPESTVSWFLTASLAAPDGGVVGGQVAGPLTAASSVIVVIAYWSDQAEQMQGFSTGLQLPPSATHQQPQSVAPHSVENVKQDGEEYQHGENINNNDDNNAEMEHDIGMENKDQNQNAEIDQHDVSDAYQKNQNTTE